MFGRIWRLPAHKLRRQAARFSMALAIFPGSLPSREQSKPPKAPAEAVEKYPSALAREIHHQLLVLPFYSVFDNIEFGLKGGNVTLTGQVVRRSLKANAEAAVKSIEGVAVVVNQIEVLPANPEDDDLRTAIYRAIFEDSTLARYAIRAVPPIHIIVKNGDVTLEGAVESTSDKTLAAARAAKAANVQSVKNNLLVQTKPDAGQ